jgi:hypothetical protein
MNTYSGANCYACVPDTARVHVPSRNMRKAVPHSAGHPAAVLQLDVLLLLMRWVIDRYV